MAPFFLWKKGVNGRRDHSAGTSRPPLPRPDSGDNNGRPVPEWEKEFCRNAYDIPWETFCENKQYIGFHRKVMEWDDSGGRENFEAAKKRFKAKYHGTKSTNWNCFRCGNQRKEDEGQHQQRDGGSMQRNQNEVQQQLTPEQMGIKTYPVIYFKSPFEDPAEPERGAEPADQQPDGNPDLSSDLLQVSL